MASDGKINEILYKSEKFADQILMNKQELVEWDKKRQGNREAIREMKKSNEKKVWITVGSMLIEMKREEAIQVMEKGRKFMKVTQILK
jgi:chaperonin cofactor prefoldin